MKRLLVICSISFWFGFLGVASAAVVVSVDTSNMVTGIERLEIGELGTYNVDFVYGTYDSIWGSGFDFNGKDEANEAIDAVRDTLNNTDIIDPTPAGVDIHTGDGGLQFYIPYEVSQEGLVVSSVSLSVSPDGYGSYEWYYNIDQNSHNFGTDAEAPWATFSQVPIPGAVWLLGSGLIGIVGVRRKFKK